MKNSIPDNFFNGDIFTNTKVNSFNNTNSENPKCKKEKEESEYGSENVWTITELINNINRTLYQNYLKITVIGEISNLKQHTSGHVYLTLKDEKSQISAVIFRSVVNKLDFNLQEGLQIICSGDVMVYPEQGRIQINIKNCEPAGAGRLYIEFEKLKKKLALKGIFDEIHKKKLPLIPKRVFLITSPTGAAVRDFIKTARHRFPPANLILVPSSVQGDKAPNELIQALKLAQKMADPQNDVIVIMRGGGSIEDLWAFNNENLAMEIFNCKVPVVSGVGHEIDYTICDFVADLRAPTPTGAAQLVFPEIIKMKNQLSYLNKNLLRGISHRVDILRHKIINLQLQLKDPVQKLNEMGMRLDDVVDRLHTAITEKLNQKRTYLIRIYNSLQRLNPSHGIAKKRQNIDLLKHKLHYAVDKKMMDFKNRLDILKVRLDSASPTALLSKGYCLVIKEEDGKIIKSFEDVNLGDKIVIRPKDGRILCEVKNKTSK